MAVLGDDPVDLLPGLAGHDGLVLAGIDVALVLDLADVLAVGQDAVHVRLIPLLAAPGLAGLGRPGLRSVALGVQFLRDLQRGLGGDEALEDPADELRLVRVDHQPHLLPIEVVPEDGVAADVLALHGRGPLLVADALADDLPLELREAEQDVQRQRG